MAARKNLSHDKKTREKIKTSQLINRLEDHVLNELELSATQIKAIEILLKKTMPDLKQIEVTGDVDKPIAIKWVNG
jgi:hypothetical protein